MTLQNTRITASCLMGAMFLFAAARPSAYGELPSHRMPFVGVVVLVVLLILALNLVGRLGRALVSAFVWVHLVIFVLELISPSPWRDGFDDTSFFLTLMVLAGAGAAFFLGKIKRLTAPPPVFETEELTWERLSASDSLGRFLGILASAFTVNSLIPLMGSGPDAGMAAGVLWFALIVISICVGIFSAVRNAVLKRRDRDASA